MISASNLERVRECPGSESLPHVDTPSDLSERGTAVHAYLANVIMGRPHLDGVPAEYHDVCEAIDVTRLPKVGTYADEIGFAFDVVTRKVRKIAPRGEGYSIGPNEIPGSADAVGVTDDAVVVIDWKGQWSKATGAADNLQLRFYALCAARIFQRDSAIVAIARVGEDGPRYDMAELTAIDLDAFESELVDIWHAAQGSKKFSEGEHCRYCPAFDSCPAKFALARVVMSGDIEAHVGVALETMDDAARAEVWRKIGDGEKLLERLRAKVRESIARKPIDCGDTMIVIGEETRRSIDAAKAVALAPELASAVKMTLTITDAEKILGKSGIDRIADSVRVTKIEKVKEVKKAKLVGANQ